VKLLAMIAPALEDELDKSWFYIHNKYAHPEIVLKDDNIILLGLDDKYVWFSVTPKEVSSGD